MGKIILQLFKKDKIFNRVRKLQKSMQMIMENSLYHHIQLRYCYQDMRQLQNRSLTNKR
jgi:hypothetical protein